MNSSASKLPGAAVVPASGYRADVDGLRAVAVAGVIAFHTGFGLTGGYVGVDVFFVISGFLITTLILKDVSAGRFTLARFWERRIRRIFPAAAVVLGCTVAAGTFLLLPGDLNDLVKSATAQVCLSANFYFWRHSGYFAGPSELKPLLHTWSLAVEEQFYLGFPILLMVCRRLSRRRLQIVLSVLVMLSFTLSVWGSYAKPSASFYLLPTRAWELLVGALLATLSRGRGRSGWMMETCSWFGLAMILYTFWVYSSATRFPGANAFVPCAGTALVIWSNSPGPTWIGRLLSLGPVVFLGLISYSLYLWHWPILAFIRYRMGEHTALWVRVAAMVASFALACLSWRYVEVPFRRRANGIPRRLVFASVLTTSAAFLLFCTMVWRLNGLPGRFSEEVVRFAQGDDFPFELQSAGVKQLETDSLPVLGCLSARQYSFLLWGDSHAMPVASALHDLAAKYELKGYVAARPAVTPLLSTWRPSVGKDAVRWNEEVLNFVRRRQIRHVILVSDWQVNIEGRENGSLDSLIVNEDGQTVSKQNAKQVLQRGLGRTVEALKQLGAEVWIMRQVPIQQQTPTEMLSTIVRRTGRVPETGVSQADHLARQLNVNDVLSKKHFPAAQILDPTGVCFDASGNSLISENGRSYYLDKNHLTSFGAQRLLKRLFEPVLQQIATSNSGQ
jgi:peptidoglycan/LPS O-acetylase OafA/YrhL